MAFPTLIKPKFLVGILNNHINFHLHIPRQHLLPLSQTLHTFVPLKIHAYHQSQDHHQHQHALSFNSLPYRRQFYTEKLAVARKLAEDLRLDKLAELKVDIIETGFPASSKDNFKRTELIANEMKNAIDKSSFKPPVIMACGRCVREDIDKTWDAIKQAKRPRLVVFISKTEISKENIAEVLKMVTEMVAYARTLCKDVGFFCEDDGRSDKELLYQLYGKAVKAGASTITFADNFTNEESEVKANILGIENADITIHWHNYLGLVTANNLADGTLKRKRTFQILPQSDSESIVRSGRCASTDKKSMNHFLDWSKLAELNKTFRFIDSCRKAHRKAKSFVAKYITQKKN